MKQSEMIDQLSSNVTKVAQASTPAAMFKTLLEASRFAAPRASIFLIRKGEVHGWGSVGYTSEIAGRQREFRQTLAGSWLQSVCDDDGGNAIEDSADSLDFGQDAAQSRVACALKIEGRPIAIVVLERGSREKPWHPQALSLMLNVGRLRLELEMATRRSARKMAAQPEPVAEAAAPAEAPSTEERSTVSAAEPAPTESAQQEASPELVAARRYAKLVATDIRLYNEEAVMLGRKNGDLVDRLGDHIERGKETFLQRHASLGAEGTGALHEAFVAVLAAGDVSLIPSKLLD